MSRPAARTRATRRLRRTAIAVAMIVVASTAAACGGSDASSGDGFVLKGADGDPTNRPSSALMGSIQMAEGWDQDSGYTLEWDVAQSAAVAIQMLASKRNDLSQGSAPAVYAAAAQDPSLRVIAFLNGPNFLFTVPENSDIQSIEDLDGKTVGVLALGATSHLLAQGTVAEAGIDVEFLPVNVGAPMAEALNSGQIDALVGWQGMWQSISDLTEEPLRPLETRLDSLAGQMVMATRQDVIDEHPEELKAYLLNFYKSCVLAANDPVRAVEDHWETFPSVKPPAAEFDEMLQKQAEWNLGFYETCTKPSEDTGLMGVPSDAEVQELYDFMRANNVVEDDIDLDEVVDTSLTEDVLADFDADAFAAELSES